MIHNDNWIQSYSVAILLAEVQKCLWLFSVSFEMVENPLQCSRLTMRSLTVTSQSLSHFSVKVWKEWGQKPHDDSFWILAELFADVFADVCLNPYRFLTWSIEELKENLTSVMSVNFPSVSSVIILMNAMNITPSRSQGYNTMVTSIY